MFSGSTPQALERNDRRDHSAIQNNVSSKLTYFTTELDTPKHHSKWDKLQLDISATTLFFDSFVIR